LTQTETAIYEDILKGLLTPKSVGLEFWNYNIYCYSFINTWFCRTI